MGFACGAPTGVVHVAAFPRTDTVHAWLPDIVAMTGVDDVMPAVRSADVGENESDVVERVMVMVTVGEPPIVTVVVFGVGIATLHEPSLSKMRVPRRRA